MTFNKLISAYIKKSAATFCDVFGYMSFGLYTSFGYMSGAARFEWQGDFITKPFLIIADYKGNVILVPGNLDMTA